MRKYGTGTLKVSVNVSKESKLTLAFLASRTGLTRSQFIDNLLQALWTNDPEVEKFIADWAASGLNVAEFIASRLEKTED